MIPVRALLLILCVAMSSATAADPGLAIRTAREITAEATRPNGDPEGLPLPLAANWNVGALSPRIVGFDPGYQLSLIEKGHHLLPWFSMPTPEGKAPLEGYERWIKRCRELNLPITMRSTQWEATLYSDARFKELPLEQNPNVIDAKTGKAIKKVSPFGPVEPWRQVGRLWTDTPGIKQIQQWYPDPPLVQFLSNNEAGDLRWHQAESSARYLKLHGEGRDDDFKRKVTADGYIERYRAMQQGMREALVSDAWRARSVFLGYEAFGPCHMGRWGGWVQYSLHSRGRISPNPLMWDGGSPSYYVHNWSPIADFTVYSPQVESMNWLFMLDEAYRLNPRFWWEISVWDGYQPGRENCQRKQYEKLGQTFTPERYGGFVKFGMWLLRPRVLREFRGHTQPLDDCEPYFMQIVKAVDAVHADPVLRAFWRKGTLVANPGGRHPYQADIPEEYRDRQRWFLLSTSLDPRQPWTPDTTLPVFALALSLDGQENSQHLLYAHSPLQDRKQVGITIPGCGEVTVDVPIQGALYIVSDGGRRVSPIAEPLAWPNETIDTWHGYRRHNFTVAGCRAWVVEPKEALPGKPWSWCMEFPDAFTERCAAPALLAEGFHHAHISVGNTFGSPAAVRQFNAFYDALRARGLAEKAVLIGLSRGGLYAYRFASENPNKVAVIYGDAPVCDFKSWPGGRGAGKGTAGDWKKLIECYGFKTEAEALAYAGNPIDTLKPLADAGIPLIHVVGDADDVVPAAENTAIIEERYRKLGGTIKVIHKPGVGHHPHGLEDPSPVVEFILEHTRPGREP